LASAALFEPDLRWDAGVDFALDEWRLAAEAKEPGSGQEVGGSNPLSPTNKINNLQPIFPDQEIHCSQICSKQIPKVQPDWQVQDLSTWPVFCNSLILKYLIVPSVKY
jgi:hypothetical protein